ncbi:MULTISPECIES: serine/threonine transporter SstT [unclassified Adlercreutzia]|uniref:serine/threonine transporter SstT n=1 Tax=unclassified Adlercreutzia TaxID=2636013 RepID=UPI0013EB15CF|nr:MULTISPECIES: serine/threonine transporter SstT [unclassified Adlercreutzia]
MAVKDIAKKYSEISLIKRIIVGLVIGVVLALVIPPAMAGAPGAGLAALEGVDTLIALLGTLFVSALKAVAPILVFFLVISALANAKTAGSMKMVLLLYIASTLIAAIVAVVATMVFPIEITLAVDPNVEQSSPDDVGTVLTTLLTNVVANPVDSLANANFLGILAWAVMLGIALRAASQNVKDVFSAVSDAVSKVVRWVINLAPFGILGLVYTSVSTNGLDIFVEYGQLILLLVGCMVFIALVTNPLLVFACTKRNPYPLVLRCLKDSGITAFFTRSSAANIPVNMELCRKLGLDKDNYSVSIPLGATINMAGAAVTITVMAMVAAHTLGIAVHPVTGVILSVLAAVSACGASGVAGGSLLLIPLACSLLGVDADVSMQVVAIGFIIGVIQDSCETALNSSSDVLFTATAEYRDQLRAGNEVHLGKDAPEAAQTA